MSCAGCECKTCNNGNPFVSGDLRYWTDAGLEERLKAVRGKLNEFERQRKPYDPSLVALRNKIQDEIDHRHIVVDDIPYKDRRANCIGWLNAGWGNLYNYLKLIPLQHRERLRREVQQMTRVDIQVEWLKLMNP